MISKEQQEHELTTEDSPEKERQGEQEQEEKTLRLREADVSKYGLTRGAMDVEEWIRFRTPYRHSQECRSR